MFQKLKEELPSLIRELEKKVPYASALATRHRGERISVSRKEQKITPENPTLGLVVTLWNGGQFYELASNSLSWEEFRRQALDLADRAAQEKPASSVFDIDPGEPLTKDFATAVQRHPESVALRDRLDQARHSLEKALSCDPKVANATSILEHVVTEELYVNRCKVLFQTLVRTEKAMAVILSDGQKTIQVWDGWGKNGGLEAVELTEGQIERLVQDGIKLLPTQRLAPGTYEVVTDQEWSGIISHECFGHGMETDLYTKDRAKSRQFLGQRVASDIVNMFDDPSLPGEAGSFFFDNEGALAKPTQVIEQGILKRGLTDLYSSMALKLERSANGRRESFARKAYARMTNTYFSEGSQTKEEMIASVQDGLYLRHATNGMEDPQGWGIQCEGLWAQEIKNGKLTDKIYSPVIMTGFVPDLLTSISMVGNDVVISGLGICGKGHKEWVKNTTGGPHLKMKAILA